MNRDKHIWEGWTVGNFIDDIEPIFDSKLIKNGLHQNSLYTRNICL